MALLPVRKYWTCLDCSLLLEGEADSRFRTLRSHKNRFGAVNELGVFGMTEQGLREVKIHRQFS